MKKNHNGMTVLMGACENGFTNIVRLLIERGAKINIRSKNGSTPLSLACAYGRLEVGALLLKSGADSYFAKASLMGERSSIAQLDMFVNTCIASDI